MIKAIFISAYASVAFLVLGIFFGTFGYVLDLPDILGFVMLLASVTAFCFGFLPSLFLHNYRRYVDRLKA